MQLQSILRQVQPVAGFVYGRAELKKCAGRAEIHVLVKPRKNSRKAVCSGCGGKRPCYDRLPQRRFWFVPLWGMAVVLLYAMRRVQCPRCGIVVEMVPWAATGKSPSTYAYTWFLSSWAKVLSWKETARRFCTSWDTVFRAVEHAVEWGLAHRNLDGIRAIGVDELSWKKGHKYLTMVYQIDNGCRRLLYIARDRTAKSFHSFFDMLGEERTKLIQFIASDMWAAFRQVIRARCCDAIHVLDRFHVMQLLNKAIDQTRRNEVRELRKTGKQAVLTKTRWILLKRPINHTDKEHVRLKDLLRCNLKSVRAYLLKQNFLNFWEYKAPWAAERFLDAWIKQALRSRIAPFGKYARTLRKHKPELLNWFKARGVFAAGATEGFNNKARITTRKSYGFRNFEHARIALYHALGNLPEPDWITHKFTR